MNGLDKIIARMESDIRAECDALAANAAENAAAIRTEVEHNAASIATAFENQLDALYSAEAMDISTDIEVLDSILKSQNLAK